MKKKWVLVSGASVAAVAMLVTTVYASNSIKIIVDGKLQQVTVQPSMVNNRVVAPVRDIAEALGAKVTWDSHANAVSIQSSDGNNEKKIIDMLEFAIAPQTPEEAVDEWAKGCKTRNAALQYAVMTPDLQAKYYDIFSKINWVTGVSSPWVQDYKVIHPSKVNENEWQFDVQFEEMSSTGIDEITTSQVVVKQIHNNWYINDMKDLAPDTAILKQSANLPDGSALNEGVTSYKNLEMVSLRLYGVAVTENPTELPDSFFSDATILSQEKIKIPAGQATLTLIQPNSNNQSISNLMYYLTMLRDYPNRNDRMLVYTLMARVTGDKIAAKQNLLDIAQTWKLPL